MINHSTRVMRALRRACLPAARTAAAIIAIAVLALLAAACSDGPSPTGSGGSADAGGSANSPSAVSYSQCMRSHGVPNFPDPGSNGGFNLGPAGGSGGLDPNSPQFQKASQACQSLMPAGS